MNRRAIIRRRIRALKDKSLAARRAGRGVESYRAKKAAQALRGLMG